MVARYDPTMAVAYHGDYVLYEDHLSEMSDLESTIQDKNDEIMRLEEKIAALESEIQDLYDNPPSTH